MSALSPTDDALLRTAPPVVDYYLAIMPRTVMLACSLNKAGATWGEVSLPFDNVTAGAWWQVIVGHTLLVYDSGGDYKGKVRVRGRSSTVLSVAANNDIQWANNDLLRVVDIFEPWAKPTGMKDTGVGGGITYYKDTDVEWQSNAQAFPPVANDLGEWAGDLGAGGYVDIPFDATSSIPTADGATIASYHLNTNGGTFVTGNANSVQQTVRFSGAGFRWVTRTVTDSNGETGILRMPVWTFGGSYQPLVECEIKRRSYEVRDGELHLEAFGDDLSEDDIAENTQVVLFARTTIGGVEVTGQMGCPFEGRGHIKFTGWILKDSVRWDAEKSTVSFTVGTLGKVADDMPGYATFIEDVNAGNAESWHTGVGLTVRNAICFLLHWHTNLLELASIEIEPADLIAGRKFPDVPPFKQIESALLMKRGVFARLGVSRWGSIHIRYDPQILDAAGRAARATVLDLSSADWTTELDFEKAHRFQMSAILGGGIAYDGSDGTPFRGRAPGAVGRQSGRDSRADNLIIDNQGDLNDKLGLLLAAESSPWAEQPIELYYDVFEPALQEYVTLTVGATENARGLAFDTDTKWIVRRVEIEDVPSSAPTVRLTVEQLVSGLAGVTVPIPDPPTYPFPAPPPDIPPSPLEYNRKLGCGGDGGYGYTLEPDTYVPTWVVHNVGLTDATFIRSLVYDPNDRPQAACIDNSGGIHTSTDAYGGANWAASLTEVQATTLVETETGDTLDDLIIVRLKACDDDGSTVLLAVVWYETNAGATAIRVLRSTDWGLNWICGGAIPSYEKYGYADVYDFERKSTSKGWGALAYDGTKLYICAGSPLHAIGKSTLNWSEDWGETWYASPIVGGLCGEDPSAVGPASAKCDSYGRLWLAPWKASPQYEDPGAMSGEMAALDIRSHAYCCGTTTVVDYPGTLTIPITGTYSYDAVASIVSLGSCPNDPAWNCNSGEGRCSLHASIHGWVFLNQNSATGSIVLQAGEVLTLHVDPSIATLCCGAITAATCVVSGIGFAVGPIMVASAEDPTDERDLVNVKELAADDGYARYHGMFDLLADDSWAALQIETGGAGNSQTVVEVNGDIQSTVDRPFRTIFGFPGDENVIYMGRSYLGNETADATYPEVVYLSADKGQSWFDVTNNLTLTSITDFIMDWDD